MENIESEITGHSRRRSGAMLPIHEIGTLGRWKSSAAFRYMEEALQDTPLNAGLSVSLSSIPGGKSAPMTPCPGTPAPQAWI